MAGFFSLGGSQNKEEEEVEKGGDKNNLLLLRNEEIYNSKGGFEIWPQSSSSYHQHQNQAYQNYFAFGVGPSRRNRSEDVSLCVTVLISHAELAVRAEGFSAKPTSRALGFPQPSAANDTNNSLRCSNNINILNDITETLLLLNLPPLHNPS